MKRTLTILFSFAIVAAITGCRSVKPVQSSTAAADTLAMAVSNGIDSAGYLRQVMEEVDKRKISYNSFSAKVKVAYTDRDGKNTDFNAYIRMRHDSAIWVSVNAVLGIEAMRMLVTPDSIRLINKLDKEYQVRPIAYLQEITRIPFDFYDLQDLIIGNPVNLTDTLVSFQTENTLPVIAITSEGNEFRNVLRVAKENYRLQSIRLEDKNPVRGRFANLLYRDHRATGNTHFPAGRTITLSDNSVLTIDLEFKQYDFNEVLSMPFTIPKNYTGI